VRGEETKRVLIGDLSKWPRGSERVTAEAWGFAPKGIRKTARWC